MSTRPAGLNPWTSPIAYLGLVCVGVAACLFAIHPFLGLWIGTPIGLIGLAAAAAVQERSLHLPASASRTTLRLLAGVCLLGLLFAAILAATILGGHITAQVRSRTASPVPGLLVVGVLQLIATYVLVGMAANTHQIHPRRCWPLVLYWLSFMPVALLAVWALYRRIF